jgi:hypothetical protein
MICNHEENKRGKLVPNGVSKQIRRSQKRDTFLASQKNRGQKQEADLGSSRLGTVFSCGKVKPSDMQSTMTRQEIEQKMVALAREYHETHDPEIPEKIFELARRLREMDH